MGCVRADASARPRRANEGVQREGQGGELVRADACSHPHGRECVRADAFFTVSADGKNPSAGKNASAG
jgi:hypothetical protein